MTWGSFWGPEMSGRLEPWGGSDRPPLCRMELKDFLRHFNTVQICSLSPEVLGPSPAGGGWHIHIFQGRWVRGFNSGGSLPGTGEAWGTPGRGGGGLWQAGVPHFFLFC